VCSSDLVNFCVSMSRKRTSTDEVHEGPAEIAISQVAKSGVLVK